MRSGREGEGKERGIWDRKGEREKRFLEVNESSFKNA
jgi:hypothetical protein